MSFDLFEPTGDWALDLVNTVVPARDGPADLLRTPDDVVDWLRRIRLASAEAEPPLPVRRRLLDETLRLRSSLQDLLRAVSAGAPPPRDAVFVMDRVLASGRRVTRLSTEAGALTLTELDEPVDAKGILAPVALAGARLAAGADPARLRTCAADDCARWFLDTSRGGSRRWCSMSTCGNRAKAARFRRRHGEA